MARETLLSDDDFDDLSALPSEAAQDAAHDPGMSPSDDSDSFDGDEDLAQLERLIRQASLRAAHEPAAPVAPLPAPDDWKNANVVDRRVFSDRREAHKARSPAPPSGLEQRRGRGRRLSDFSRSAQEGEMTGEQFLFLMAIEEFKKANARTFPTWTDVLEIIRLLGYRKTMPSELNLPRAEDWQELPTAPANVRPQDWEKRKAA